ncbi:hypothetical protein SDC9_85728 [bioreactor metagenome]|uniref:Outer membrane protein beta-barrel domain-containing protein n=1 Tax=bioreactor metagenome TaxID=1076179 RepID=A0A644ZE11_9ZZZZ
MLRYVRTSACTVLLLLLSALSVFASPVPVRIMITPTSEEVVAIRYQSGTNEQESWIEVDASHPYISLETFDSTQEVLFVQQKEPGKDWSRSYEYQHDSVSRTWSLVEKAKETEEAYTLGLYATAYTSTNTIDHLYQYSCGAGLESTISLPFNRNLSLVVDLDAQYANSNNIWTDSYTLLGGSMGLGYRFQLGNNFQMIPSLSYGVLAHHCEECLDGTDKKTWYTAQQATAVVRFEFPIRQSMLAYLRIQARLMIEQENTGLLYGAGTGIRFAW